MKNAMTLASGIALGATLGAVSAVLTAPRSGKETRERLKEQSNQLRKRGKRQTEKLELEPLS